MFPVIAAIGPFTISSLGVCIALGFFFGSFSIWRRAKEEHFEDDEIFDAVFISFFSGLLIGRVSYIFLHLSQFGLNIGKWFNLAYSNGFSWFGFLIGLMTGLWVLASKKKWDFFDFIDLSVFGVIIGHIFVEIGLFLDGSYVGKITKLPWGLVFPGIEGKRHPLPLYELLILFGVYFFIRWLDKHYRLFSWYQDNRGEARPGILWLGYTSIFVLSQLFIDFMAQRDHVFLIFSPYQGLLILYLIYAGIAFWLRMGHKISKVAPVTILTSKKEETLEAIRPAFPEVTPRNRFRRFSRAKAGLDSK